MIPILFNNQIFFYYSDNEIEIIRGRIPPGMRCEIIDADAGLDILKDKNIKYYYVQDETCPSKLKKCSVSVLKGERLGLKLIKNNY